MKISVVLATCNGADYLAGQLATLSAQSRVPDELIVSDDASTDTTLQILQAFQAGAPFPVSIHVNANRLGYVRNFSNAALMANGDVILFCDQDDHWATEKIESVERWFGNNPGMSLVTHNIRVCDEHLDVRIADYFRHLDRNHARHAFLKGCATAARRELVEAAFPLPASSAWNHDTRIHAIAKTRSESGYIDLPLVDYRVHRAQASGYVIASKGLARTLLAMLDERSIKASEAWVNGLRLLPRPHTEAALRELLEACGYGNQAPIAMPVFDRMQHRDALVTRRGEAWFARAARLLNFYLGGGYKGIGGTPQYLADAIRLAGPEVPQS